MSYTFLQEQGEASSAESFAEIPAYVLSRLNITAEKCCSSDNETAYFRNFPSGTTLEHSTEHPGAETLTSSAVDFPAKTSVQPGKVQGSQAQGADCGKKWQGLLVKYNHDLFLSRIVLCSEQEACVKFSKTLPRWGTMQNGVLSERATPEHLTNEIGCGFWPTPTKNANGDCKSERRRKSPALETIVKMYPTPTVCGNYNRKGASATSGDGLATVVRMFHTPTTNGLDGGSNSRKAAKKRGEQPPSGGSLNPTWVEWLMGWPLGWTDLKPLVMDKFRKWLDSHLIHYQKGGDELNTIHDAYSGTDSDLAKFFGITTKTLREHMKNGPPRGNTYDIRSLPHIKKGRMRYWNMTVIKNLNY